MKTGDTLASVFHPRLCPARPSQASLTLLRPESWHRRCGRQCGRTKQRYRWRKRWRRRGGRCSSTTHPRLRSCSSRRSAVPPKRQQMNQCIRGQSISSRAALRWIRGSSRGLRAAIGMTGRRTEAVLEVALREAAPTERAERRADRANMVSWSWLAGCGEGRGSVGGACGSGRDAESRRDRASLASS